MKNIHVITAFSRFELLEKLIQAYKPMGIIWHPVLFDFEADKLKPYRFSIPIWAMPRFVPDPDDKTPRNALGYVKKNAFIQDYPIVDDDYYIFLDDDDLIEPDAFSKIREIEADVIMISMQRGHHQPKDVPEVRRYGTDTLVARPDNMTPGKVSNQQYVMKGWVLKQVSFENERHNSDGVVAMWLSQHFKVRYEPDIFSWFNYFEPGRWDPPTFRTYAFGVMVNDLTRFNMCMQQSEIDPAVSCHIVKKPSWATKGLNILLGEIEKEGADIGVLAHQDMFFRQGWIEQVMEQIDQLPDSWIVAGVVGKDMSGEIAGQFHDMRLPAQFSTMHVFPAEACCFDEAVILVNMKKGFRFDEELRGFDLYGTMAVLQAWEMGGTAWVIDAFCEHYCMRPFTWVPDKQFQEGFKWLHQRFPAAPRIDTTVLGVKREHSRPRYDEILNAPPESGEGMKYPAYRDPEEERHHVTV